MSDSFNKVAVIFPGQGSQKVGMFNDYDAFMPIISEVFAEASQTIGFDLFDLVQNGPPETLNLTENAQPALVAASTAIWRAWQTQSSFEPTAVAGHSLGEWSALVAADVIKFEDAVKLVQLRGQFMQSAVPVGLGAMAAIIGLSDEAVEDVCKTCSDSSNIVTAVNYNSPGQLVIAGHTEAVNKAINGCKELGAKRALSLPVSAPFHTALMKPAADRLAEHIENTHFSSPKFPIVQNVFSSTAQQSPETIKANLIEQIYSPVPWVKCIEKLINVFNVEAFVECGPGKVLSGLNKRIAKSMPISNTASGTTLAETITNLKG